MRFLRMNAKRIHSSEGARARRLGSHAEQFHRSPQGPNTEDMQCQNTFSKNPSEARQTPLLGLLEALCPA